MSTFTWENCVCMWKTKWCKHFGKTANSATLLNALQEGIWNEGGCAEGGHNEGCHVLPDENEWCVLNVGLDFNLENKPLESQ